MLTTLIPKTQLCCRRFLLQNQVHGFFAVLALKRQRSRQHLELERGGQDKENSFTKHAKMLLFWYPGTVYINE